MLAGKEIMGKSSDRVGGGEEVAGVLEAGVPFPPAPVPMIRGKEISEWHFIKSIVNAGRFGSFDRVIWLNVLT